jgi:drug/metabolite transporter (DMT)-like permease
MMVVAICAAFGAAATFAFSTSVQHHANSSVPHGTGTLGMLGHLARRPTWLFGQILALGAFALHALALHSGPLAIVQPIIISGIVWAVPARAAMSRRLPTRAELLAVALTAGGLAAFLVASNPTPGDNVTRNLSAATITIAAVGIAVVAYFGAAVSRQHPARRALLLGVTSGVLFGLVAGLLKMALDALHDGGFLGMATSWSLWTLIVVGLAGVYLNQRAYQTAALSQSMPVLNIVDVLVALVFGLFVFHEIPNHSVGALAVEALGLAAIGFGLHQLVNLEQEFLGYADELPDQRTAHEHDDRAGRRD